jgi:2-polyprenyl-3-methyl-5-hydroxy-6-metoxy-1,4-benzoquinol methylase
VSEGSAAEPGSSVRPVRHAEFEDPRLVEVYDAEYPWLRDDDFFLSIVNETPRSRVLDLGCGTGRLAIGMAAAGHVVTGVDPARASLEAARVKPGAARVTWVEGTSATLRDDAFDVTVMTSHVAQFFVSDEAWSRTLGDLKRTLIPDGVLAFDTRDPRAREWERWNPVDSRRSIELPDGRIIAAWTEVTAVSDNVVSFVHHYDLTDGVTIQSSATLRFRSEEVVRASLGAAGIPVERIYGGWHREPVGEGDGELIVVARS